MFETSKHVPKTEKRGCCVLKIIPLIHFLIYLISTCTPRFRNSLNNNYSMSPSWIWSDKITNERVARVGYNHFISNKGEWNTCFSKFSNRVLPPIFISTILQSVQKEKTWRIIFHMT